MEHSSSSLHPPPAQVAQLVAAALAEDIGPIGDLSAALLPPHATQTAQLVSRQPGVLAGTACATETFCQVNPSLNIIWHATDGDRITANQPLAEISGQLASICTAERVALNFLSHLSGIATRTSQFVDLAAGKVAVFDTRKTTPGLRSLEKAAVRAGGGRSHRSSLSEWIMLKDNHQTALPIPAAVAQAAASWPARKVQVECDTRDQAAQAIAAGADALLLDNMTPAEVAAVVELVDANPAELPRGRPYLEVSGGITLDNLAGYVDLKIDAVSSGSLVGAAVALDIGLDID